MHATDMRNAHIHREGDYLFHQFQNIGKTTLQFYGVHFEMVHEESCQVLILTYSKSLTFSATKAFFQWNYYIQ